MNMKLLVDIQILLCYLLIGVHGEERDNSEQVCFTLDNANISDFYLKHSELKRLKEVQIGETTFYCATLVSTRNGKAVNPETSNDYVTELKNTGEVPWAERQQRKVRVTKTPEYVSLWYMNDAVLPSMKVVEAWSAGYSGNGVMVAILDDGLQTNHIDLAANVDTVNDRDIYGFDDNPIPAAGKTHGTKCAGLVAAVANNSECTVGVAYQSTLLGVRILGNFAISDSEEGDALSHYSQGVDIYSNSWGPADGTGFDAPGSITMQAIQTGVTNGRGGKGAIYTWSAGNGGLSDNCNADGYVNSIYTIAISGIANAQNAWYSEVCAATLASAYGGSEHYDFLTTTTSPTGCITDGVQGTSFSSAVASGIIALVLQANPNLTWRDVQHLIVYTSSSDGLNDTLSGFLKNGANLEYSQVLGFGLMNALSLVKAAEVWTNVPNQQTCNIPTITDSRSTSGSSILLAERAITNSDCSSINFLEHVTVTININYDKLRGVSLLFLESPAGTESQLLSYRQQDAIDNPAAGSLSWTFMSVHFWKETPIGTWKLKVQSFNGLSVVTLDSWALTFYGTVTDSWPASVEITTGVQSTEAESSSTALTTESMSTEQITTTESMSTTKVTSTTFLTTEGSLTTKLSHTTSFDTTSVPKSTDTTTEESVTPDLTSTETSRRESTSSISTTESVTPELTSTETGRGESTSSVSTIESVTTDLTSTETSRGESTTTVSNTEGVTTDLTSTETSTGEGTSSVSTTEGVTTDLTSTETSRGESTTTVSTTASVTPDLTSTETSRGESTSSVSTTDGLTPDLTSTETSRATSESAQLGTSEKVSSTGSQIEEISTVTIPLFRSTSTQTIIIFQDRNGDSVIGMAMAAIVCGGVVLGVVTVGVIFIRRRASFTLKPHV